MPNPFTKLIMNFGGLGQPVPSMNQQMPYQQQQMPNPQQMQMPSQGQPDPYQYYQPQYDMQNRFAGLLDNYPQMKEPGKWKKLAAIIAGAGSKDPVGTARDVAYGGYYNRLAQYNNQAKLMQQSADNERQMNQVGMGANNQLRNYEINQRKADTADFNADTKRITGLAYEFKQRNPQLKIELPAGGYITAIDPITGEGQYVLDNTGNPIPTGKLSEQDRINLTGEKRMQQIGAQQAGAMDRAVLSSDTQKAIQGMRGDQASEQIAQRATEARETKKVIPGKAPGSTGTGYTSETQKAQALKTRAAQLVSQHPEWAPFIQYNPNTKLPEVVPPSSWSGATKAKNQAIAAQISQELYGNQTAAPITNVNMGSLTGGADSRRQKAIDLLNQNKIPVNDKNIAEMIKQAGIK